MRFLRSAPAGRFARRLGAYLLDCLILFAGVLVTQGVILALGWNPLAAQVAAGEPVGGAALNGWVFATVTVPCLLYFAGFHAGPRGATPGKRWLGLRVTDAAGARIGLGPALLRAAVTLLPFEWNHVALFYLMPQDGETTLLAWGGIGLTWVMVLGYALCIVIDRKGRSPADWAAGTRVAYQDLRPSLY